MEKETFEGKLSEDPDGTCKGDRDDDRLDKGKSPMSTRVKQ